jgi:hypothetical protein
MIEVERYAPAFKIVEAHSGAIPEVVAHRDMFEVYWC